MNVELDSERIFRTLVEFSPDAIMLIAPDGIIMLGNDEAARLHGFTRKNQLPGQNIYNFIAHDEHQRVIEWLGVAAEIGAIKGVEHMLYRVDGSQFPAELSISVIRNETGALEAYIGIVRDITERRAAQVKIDMLVQALQMSNDRLEQSYDATLKGWVRALDMRDHETGGHSWRVSMLSVKLARSLRMDETAIRHLKRGALLHDIGKMGIPDSILLKPGPLTEQEWVIMRQHTTYAYQWLSAVDFLRHAIDIPYCHHEKWDGSGYPRKLQGEQIPLSARIFSVVDVWDALRSKRPYRPAVPEQVVRAYLEDQSGTHFDPEVAAAFLKLDVRRYDRGHIPGKPYLI